MAEIKWDVFKNGLVLLRAVRTELNSNLYLLLCLSVVTFHTLSFPFSVILSVSLSLSNFLN
jgi:hypothetical protein